MNTNVCFDLLYNFCMIHLSLEEKLSDVLSCMYVGLRVNHSSCLSDFNLLKAELNPICHLLHY